MAWVETLFGFRKRITAPSLVLTVPIVVGFLLLQKHLVQGLTAGAVR